MTRIVVRLLLFCFVLSIIKLFLPVHQLDLNLPYIQLSWVWTPRDVIMTDPSITKFFILGKCVEECSKALCAISANTRSSEGNYVYIFTVLCDVYMYVYSHWKKKRMLHPVQFFLKHEKKMLWSEETVDIRNT